MKARGERKGLHAQNDASRQLNFKRYRPTGINVDFDKNADTTMNRIQGLLTLYQPTEQRATHDTIRR
jgi:hypothetical protein